VEGEDGVHGVVVPGEHGLELGLIDVLLQGVVSLPKLGHQTFVLFLVAHLAQGHEVGPLALSLCLGIHLAAQVFHALEDLLGLLQVVPETVGGALGFQQVQFPLGAGKIQGLAQFLQARQQIVELHFIFVELQHGVSLPHV
jgi:hypothetical protein